MNKPVKKIVASLLAASLLLFAVPFTSSALNGTASYEPSESNIAVKYWVTTTATSGANAAYATDQKLAANSTENQSFYLENLDTAWVPASLPATLNVDLGGAYAAVRKVETYFADNNAVYKYILEGSKNGTNWTVLADRSTNTELGGIFTDVFAFEGLCAVRITVLSGTAGIKNFRVINYLRKDMDNGSDTSTVSQTTNYNAGVAGVRGGVMNAASKLTGNNFFGMTKDMGWDTIRLRIWNEPKSEGDWRFAGDINEAISVNPPSLTTGITNCSPTNQLNYAGFVVGAGQNLAIDFHYADSWSDPQNQPKPYAWAELEFDALVQKTYEFTYDYIKQLIQQGTAPTVVAIGNEITNGMMWGSEYINVNPFADYHDYYKRFIRDNSPANMNEDGTTKDGRLLNPNAKPGGGVEWIKYEEANGNKTSPEYLEFLASIRNLSLLIDAGNRALAALNTEFNLDIQSELHFAFNVFEQPRNGTKVAMDPEEVFEKVQTLVGGIAGNLNGLNGMVDRIGVSYYPDWHGTYGQVQRNVVELSKMLPAVKFNIAECSPASSGTNSNWMSNPNFPVGTTYNTQSQGDITIDIMEVINDVPNNAGMGVWPWSGQSVYGTGSTLRAGFLAWNDAFAKNVVEAANSVVTVSGEAPVLPATLKSVDVATGVATELPVVWDAVAPASYENVGTFTVNGTVAPTVPETGRGKAMTKVTATVDVVAMASVQAETGENVMVPILLKDCANVSGVQGVIDYDSDLLTLDSVAGKNGFVLQSNGNKFIAVAGNSAGLEGDVIVGYAIFKTKAGLLDDVSTYVTFPSAIVRDKNGQIIDQDVAIVEVTVVGEPPIIGDVNLDGVVDLADAILLMQYASGSINLTSKQLKAAEVNKDGIVNVGDVIIIMQMCIA